VEGVLIYRQAFMKETIIIELLQQGKIEKAFTRLYKTFPQVRSVLKKYGANKDQVNDIFQDALVVLYQKLQQEDFKIQTSIESYLMNTCKYMFLRLTKTANRVGSLDASPMEPIQEEADIEQILSEDKKVQQAETALQQIGEKCREILTSFYIGKKSMTEIAKEFSYSSENAAKTQKYKCLEAARKNYNTLKNIPNN
jgi:RNA polymerase sigma factor (sigma-70 family)